MSDPPHSDSQYSQSNPVVPPRVTAAILAAILGVAIVGPYFFYSRGLTQLYGDAFAHMEAARRLFDSLTPGYSELGSVWLPMYHLLTAPLAINDHLWRTGLAGSLVSVAAFCVSAWVLFRLALEMNRSLAAALVALTAFLLCPTMIYLASTPMTESLAILWTLLAVYGLFRFQMSGRTRCLVGAGVAVFFGTLTRYGEWYILPFAALFVFLARQNPWRIRLRRATLFSLIGGAGPLLWMLHDWVSYANPLAFYNGPDSAQAVYARQVATTAFPYPTDGSLLMSARYYIEDLKLLLGPWCLVLAVFGLVMWILERRLRSRRAAAFLLLVLLPFYVQALATSAVGLYVPSYFPHTYYNLRYGIELLPAIALLASFAIPPMLSWKSQAALLALFLAALGAQNALMLAGGTRDLPVVKEGILNTPCKSGPDRALVDFFRRRYDGQRILMQSAEWPCVAPALGIPYHKILCGNNTKYWHRIPDGAQKLVGWVVSGERDPVDILMRAYPGAFKDFKPVFHKNFSQQKGITIYRREGR